MGLFLEQALDADDPRLAVVEAHFERNIRKLVKLSKREDVALVCCTTLTNDRDFAPFLSGHRSGLSEGQLKAWQDALTEADSAWGEGRLAAALAAYRKAWELDAAHADLAYRIGRLLMEMGRAPEAAPFLVAARDLDRLRFRASSRLNEVVRKVAGEGDHLLLDWQQQGSALNAGGVAGDELLYEHVHLNFLGTCQLALRLAESLSTQWITQGRLQASSLPWATYEELRLRLGYTLFEQSLIVQELLGRFERPPFTAQRDHASRLALWRQRLEAISSRLKDPVHLSRMWAAYEKALELHPQDWILMRNYGMARLSMGDATAALPLLTRARQWIGDDPDLLFALATSMKRCDNPSAASEVFEELRRLEPRYPGLP
jgi:tetratricopeptide (TPR) repeat protein